MKKSGALLAFLVGFAYAFFVGMIGYNLTTWQFWVFMVFMFLLKLT